MSNIKKSRIKSNASLKEKVAIEAIKNLNNVQEIASKFLLPPTPDQVGSVNFRRTSLLAFRSKPEKEDSDIQAEPLYNKIGQLQIENDF